MPAAILLLGGAYGLFGALSSYSHFVAADAPFYVVRTCQLDSDGSAGRVAFPEYQGETVSCLCSSFGCVTLDKVQQSITWRIVEASLYTTAGAVLVVVFLTKRKYLKAYGALDKRPRIISAIGLLTIAIGIVTFLVPARGWGQEWEEVTNSVLVNGDVRELLYSLTFFARYAMVISIIAIAIGICTFVFGQKKQWVWKANLVLVSASLAVILASMDYYQVIYLTFHEKLVLLVLAFITLYLLIRSDTRAYYYRHHRASAPIAS